MSSSTDWETVKYEEVFEQELRALQRRRDSDRSCTIADLESVLKNMYIMAGAEGMGEVAIIGMAASIAAHEHFIAQWKQESTG